MESQRWPQKHGQQKKEIDKLDFIKIKKFYVLKDIINKVKRQLTEEEEIFAYHLSNKSLGIENIWSTLLTQQQKGKQPN